MTTPSGTLQTNVEGQLLHPTVRRTVYRNNLLCRLFWEVGRARARLTGRSTTNCGCDLPHHLALALYIRSIDDEVRREEATRRSSRAAERDNVRIGPAGRAHAPRVLSTKFNGRTELVQYGPNVTLAEWACGEASEPDAPGMPRPCRRFGEAQLRPWERLKGARTACRIGGPALPFHQRNSRERECLAYRSVASPWSMKCLGPAARGSSSLL